MFTPKRATVFARSASRLRGFLVRSRVGKDDTLNAVETPNRVERARCDPAFAAQMEATGLTMRKNRDVLKKRAE